MGKQMDKLALDFLAACEASICHRLPLIAELATTLGVQPEELGYLWAAGGCSQQGSLSGGEWVYYFHGDECDIWHATDKRFVRVDFGPRGVLTAFTVVGVTQFVMKAKSPWDEFPRLQQYLATSTPPYDIHSGSLERAGVLYDQLEGEGLVGVAAPDLIAFARQHCSLNTEGIAVHRLTPGTSDRTWFDVSVAERKIVTDTGRSFLASICQS
jgi:hypothetical protein